MENTLIYDDSERGVQDHLHIRGEYLFIIIYQRLSMGSPPHTWRILTGLTNFHVRIRITSTYVENTCFSLASIDPAWDHLHIRGEYKTPKK